MSESYFSFSFFDLPSKFPNFQKLPTTLSKTFQEFKNFDHTKPLPYSWVPVCTNLILLFIVFLLTVQSLRP